LVLVDDLKNLRVGLSELLKDSLKGLWVGLNEGTKHVELRVVSQEGKGTTTLGGLGTTLSRSLRRGGRLWLSLRRSGSLGNVTLKKYSRGKNRGKGCDKNGDSDTH
jgi:hypothetical protein